MERTGKYRIIFHSGHSKLDYYWTEDKAWSENPERAKIYTWEEKWATKELPRDGIWEELPWKP